MDGSSPLANVLIGNFRFFIPKPCFFCLNFVLCVNSRADENRSDGFVSNAEIPVAIPHHRQQTEVSPNKSTTSGGHFS
jgi:hypothetical protein